MSTRLLLVQGDHDLRGNRRPQLVNHLNLTTATHPDRREAGGRTTSSRINGDMMKLRFLPFAGILLAASLTVAACGAQGGSPTAAPSTRQASVAASSTAPADTAATAPVSSPSATAGHSSGQSVSPAPPASAPAKHAGFASALAAWKNAAAAPAATMNEYLQRAADDLRAAGDSGYGSAIAELTYLAHLPATNDTATQQANARSDVQALDNFFGTPGLLS